MKSKAEEFLKEEAMKLSAEDLETMIKQAMREKGYTTYIDWNGEEKPL